MKKSILCLLLVLVCLFVTSCGAISESQSSSNLPHEHSYSNKVTKAPTCKTEGVRTYSCKCGDSYKEAVKIDETAHDWADATCKDPKTCKLCGVTEGTTATHNFSAATCVSAKTCKTCGITEGGLGNHTFKAATCTSPKTCSVCGKTEGTTAAHDFSAATCSSPKKCKTCGKTEGTTTAHSFNAATCTSPKKCKVCGKTEGTTVAHNFSAATCTSPKKCKTCGKTEGSTAAHSYNAATCTAPKKCKTCGRTEGSALGHNYSNGSCTRCSASDPNFVNIVYEKITYDNSYYENKASIENISINDEKLFITYKILEHNGGTYDAFATDAVFYDANNNILDITQVMYANNIGTAIGRTYDDYTYIPEGTKTVLINSATKNVKYKVSSNHGNPSIKVDVPKICYDKEGYGNSVEVKSYNVYDDYIYLTYVINGYYGGGFNAFATQMVFYDSNGNILKTTQVMYASHITNSSIGNVYFDYAIIPDGTASILVRDNRPSNAGDDYNQGTGNGSNSGSSNGSSQGKWGSTEISIVKNKVNTINDTVISVTTAASTVSTVMGSTFGNSWADAEAQRVKSGLYKTIQDLNSISSYINSKEDLTFVTGDGKRLSLKGSYSNALSIAKELYNTPLSSSVSKAEAEAFSDRTDDLLLSVVEMYTILKNR